MLYADWSDKSFTAIKGPKAIINGNDLKKSCGWFKPKNKNNNEKAPLSMRFTIMILAKPNQAPNPTKKNGYY